jgi:DNA-binding transcriptional LysR family regulator
MEMHQIRYFLAVARTLNFTRAAEECNVSQPSLTRAVHLLEEELGGPLLRRERALSHLTELGQRMLPLLQQCYDNAQTAKALARSVKTGAATTLTLGLSRSIDIELLVRPLTELVRAFTNVQLRIVRGASGDVLEWLKSGACELAVAGQFLEGWERLDRWKLFSEPFEVVLNRKHALAGRNALEPQQLAAERVMYQPGCDIGDEHIGLLRGAGIAIDRAHELCSDQDLMALVVANVGVGLVPASARRYEALDRAPLQGVDLRRTVTVYGVAGRERSAPVATLLKMLRAADWSAHTVH